MTELQTQILIAVSTCLTFALKMARPQPKQRVRCMIFVTHTSLSSSIAHSFLAFFSLYLCLASDAILSNDSRIGTHMGRKSGM